MIRLLRSTQIYSLSLKVIIVAQVCVTSHFSISVDQLRMECRSELVWYPWSKTWALWSETSVLLWSVHPFSSFSWSSSCVPCAACVIARTKTRRESTERLLNPITHLGHTSKLATIWTHRGADLARTQSNKWFTQMPLATHTRCSILINEES